MKVTIIGSGQQGGSIARALDATGHHEVSIYDTSAQARDLFGQQENTATIKIAQTAASAVQDADVVFLATPIDQFASVIDLVASDLKQGTIITDIGSGKTKAIEEISNALPDQISYVPGHPIIGRSGPGPAFSDPKMYDQKTIVIVPTSGDEGAQNTVCTLWGDMGAQVTLMDAPTHDQIYGTLSHFQHVVTFALTKMMEDPDHDRHASQDLKQGGRGLLSMSRLSVGSPDMWHPIFIDNKAAIMQAADEFRVQSDALQKALDSKTPDAFKELLKQAHDYRSDFKDEARENIHGEIADLPQNMTDQFNEVSEMSLVRQIAFPAFLGAAVTLNAQQTDHAIASLDLKSVANPSFKDGSAAMLNDPDYMAQFLFDHRAALMVQLDEFSEAFEELMDAISAEDGQVITAYIENVNAIQADGVPKKPDPSTVRDAYRL